MAKTHLDITIDAKLVKKAKRLGLNMSNYFETCLDSFLNITPQFIKEYIRVQNSMQRNIRKSSVNTVKAIMGVKTKKSKIGK